MTHNTLLELLKLNENEIIEFKEAKNDFDFNKLGKYFSALSNEANLHSRPFAWLVFGVEDKQHKIVGTHYRAQSEKYTLTSLKQEVANKTTNNLSFIDIDEVMYPCEKTGNLLRILLFKIPAAPKGIPIAFDGYYHARNGESLTSLNIEKIERIRQQSSIEDWSAKIVETATIDDLDPDAILIARRNYQNKFPDKKEEMKKWDDITFLNKAKITIKGKITRTAIILLGKEESEHFLSPADVKIRWKLVDNHHRDVDYRIFGIPLLLAVEQLFAKIRNIRYHYMQEDSIFPQEISQYEPFSIREALNNCIAHQDYNQNARINVIEMQDQLIFTNHGTFIPESVQKVIIDDSPEEFYRNRFLANAMFNLKMVDTAGGGIKKMFYFQTERFFPLPDYDFSDNKVKLTLFGKVLDENYAKLLAKNKSITLEEIILLDRVAKKLPLTVEEEKQLRAKKFIEGRKPNYYIGLKAVEKTPLKLNYTKNKAFEKSYYLDLIVKALQQHSILTRQEINTLLWDKLPDWMDDKQKNNKIKNLLSELKSRARIINSGTNRAPQWQLPMD